MERVLLDDVVETDYGQFDIVWGTGGGFDGDFGRFFAGQVNGLAGAADPECLSIILARRSGGSAVKIVLHDCEPEHRPAYQDVVEVSITIPPAAEVSWSSWAGQSSGVLPGVRSGSYRVRVSGRDRDAGRAGEFEDQIVDHYLIELWPAPPDSDAILRIGSDDAAYWHHELGSQRPKPRRPKLSIEQKRQRLIERTIPAQAGEFFWDLTELRLDEDYHQILAELAPTVTTPVQVNLYRTGLTEIPDWLLLVPQLWSLFVHYNKVTTVPPWFAELTQLKRFAIAFNRDLATLPDVVAELPSLQQLELDGTAITRLPESMSTMTVLAHLDLQQTPLAELPNWIGQLTNLRFLDLSKTAITRLPDSIGDLANLEYLALENTAITTVPETLATLPNLRALKLSHTHIAELPSGLLSRHPPVDLSVDATPFAKRHRKRQH